MGSPLFAMLQSLGLWASVCSAMLAMGIARSATRVSPPRFLVLAELTALMHAARAPLHSQQSILLATYSLVQQISSASLCSLQARSWRNLAPLMSSNLEGSCMSPFSTFAVTLHSR